MKKEFLIRYIGGGKIPCDLYHVISKQVIGVFTYIGDAGSFYSVFRGDEPLFNSCVYSHTLKQVGSMKYFLAESKSGDLYLKLGNKLFYRIAKSNQIHKIDSIPEEITHGYHLSEDSSTNFKKIIESHEKSI